MKRTGIHIKSNGGSMMCCVRYGGCYDVDVYFPRYDWLAKHVQYANFKNGSVKCPYEPTVFGHGYIGEGAYKTRENNKPTRVYTTWTNMFQRCYDPKYHEKEPSYIGCEVCEEWCNFQFFAEWYEQNYYEIDKQRMALDKDILVKGNKLYSPETCCFVPQSINTLFIKRDALRGALPIGVSYNKQYKKYTASCNNKCLGKYDTPEEAFNSYKQFKEAFVKKVADQYKDLIPEKLYNAMYEYEVDIDD